jgi:hypothetical protein
VGGRRWNGGAKGVLCGERGVDMWGNRGCHVGTVWFAMRGKYGCHLEKGVATSGKGGDILGALVTAV